LKAFTVKKLKMHYLQSPTRDVKTHEFQVRFTGTPAAIRRLKRGVSLVLTNKDYQMILELVPAIERAARKTRTRKAAA